MSSPNVVCELVDRVGGPSGSHAERMGHDPGPWAELASEHRTQFRIGRGQQVERHDRRAGDVRLHRILEPELDQMFDAGGLGVGDGLLQSSVDRYRSLRLWRRISWRRRWESVRHRIRYQRLRPLWSPARARASVRRLLRGSERTAPSSAARKKAPSPRRARQVFKRQHGVQFYTLWCPRAFSRKSLTVKVVSAPMTRRTSCSVQRRRPSTQPRIGKNRRVFASLPLIGCGDLAILKGLLIARHT